MLLKPTLVSSILAVGLALAGRADSALRWDAARSNEVALVRGNADVWRFHYGPAAATTANRSGAVGNSSSSLPRAAGASIAARPH